MSIVTWGPDSGLQVWGVMSWGCLTILFVGLGLFECVLRTQRDYGTWPSTHLWSRQSPAQLEWVLDPLPFV